MKSVIFNLLLLVLTVQASPPGSTGGFEPFESRNFREFTQSANGNYEKPLQNQDKSAYKDSLQVIQTSPGSKTGSHFFNNPAGCALKAPIDKSPEDMLANVQNQLGDALILKERRISYIWNGVLGSFVDVSGGQIAYEFEVNEFQPPFTYRGDQAVTIFLQNGFAVWLRFYGGKFRLLAVPMINSDQENIWSEYVQAYWQKDGQPKDETIVPVSKKLPCHWMIEEGYVSYETVLDKFILDSRIPDYLTAGRQYLADTCSEAYRISQEEIGFWDATSMCGPLTWQINQDANSFPYRIGSYDANARLFINANPRYGGTRPWVGFDPETYDLFRTDQEMPGYDFETRGNLYPGDILFSYGSPNQWSQGGGHFSHIFIVAGIDENNSRLTVTNIVKNHLGVEDCFIREEILYTPGDQETGVINYGWNDHGYGQTGKYGFDVFRWKWISYHLEGKTREYRVRWGETLETIAFDWKVYPGSISEANHLAADTQLIPGQSITLPVPTGLYSGGLTCPNCFESY